MTRAHLKMVLAASVTLLALAACGPKKMAVERRDFEEVDAYVQKNLRDEGVPAEKRLSYVVSKLGAPHRTNDGSSYWYSSKSNCYYLQVGGDGWTSWGTGITAECEKYAVKP
jgi:hypothetical protein